MRKISKNLMLLSILLLGCLCFTGCGKDDKDSGDSDTTEVVTTTEAVSTTELQVEEKTTEATTEATTEEVEERAPYVVTDSVDTSNVVAVEASETNPAKVNEWVEMLEGQGSGKPKAKLYIRTTGVKRGEEAMAIIKEYEANGGYFKFDPLEYDDLEYCVMDYQVYFPEDYPCGDYGIAFSSISFFEADGDNSGLIGNYIGMTQTYDISDRVKGNTVFPGDVISRQLVFVMVKDYTDYMLYSRYYDDNKTEFVKYVTCESNTGTGSAPASGETTEEPGSSAAPAGNLSTTYADLDNRSFAYNGVVYTLGVSTLQDMIDDGVPFDEDDIANAGNNLSPNHQSQGFKITLGKYYSAQVYMGNWTDEGKPIAECPITQIYLPVKQDMDNSMLTFAFPLDITEEELLANSGEPTELREFVPEGESYSNNTYNYKRDGEHYAGTSGYSFQFMKGVLKYLYIDIN